MGLGKQGRHASDAYRADNNGCHANKHGAGLRLRDNSCHANYCMFGAMFALSNNNQYYQ